MTLFSFYPISTHKIQHPQLQRGKIQNRLHEKNLNPPTTYGGNTNTPATYGKIETVHLYGENSNSPPTGTYVENPNSTATYGDIQNRQAIKGKRGKFKTDQLYRGKIKIDHLYMGKFKISKYRFYGQE